MGFRVSGLGLYFLHCAMAFYRASELFAVARAHAKSLITKKPEIQNVSNTAFSFLFQQRAGSDRFRV